MCVLVPQVSKMLPNNYTLLVMMKKEFIVMLTCWKCVK